MSNPIRVLQVVTHMNCGGLESMLMNYYRAIDREKVQFDFLTHRPIEEKKDYDDEILSLGGHIYHVSSLNPFSFSYIDEIDAFFKTHREYNVVHVHQDCMSGVILKVAKKNHIPVRIAHCHSSNQDFNIKYLIKFLYKGRIKKYATKMFSCGTSAGKWMFETNEFEVLPNAIDATKYRYNIATREKIRNELKLNDSIVIGHVGRFSTVKNHIFIIEVVERLIKKSDKIRVLFVGQGELQDDIKRLVRERNLDRYVCFLGLRTDVSELMQAMDLFILPSLYEGLPVSIVEAQAAGLKCIVSDKVPLDCAISDLVSHIPLELSAESWAEEIKKKVNYSRVDMYEIIKNAGYDIKNNAEYLQNYYLSHNIINNA